jgi:diguanylate cyclase (GGDEF)-like protein
MDLPSLTPLVLLVDDQEWTSRSIESILRPKGHVVLKAYTGRQALDLVQKVSPDAMIVDFHLPDLGGIEVARELRRAPTVHSVTPLLMISASSVGRAERLEAFGAGAWDILRHPVDPGELVLRVETLVRAKQEADRIREEGLTDPGTGFYNARGLLRRAHEMSADAIRFERPLACVAFGPGWLDRAVSAEAAQASDPFSEGIARALKSITRGSDTVGRLASGEFVVVAPGTDRDGAVRLADRVLRLVHETPGGAAGLTPEEFRLRAGFYATAASEPVNPEDLLFKATMALRRAQVDEGGFPVRAYGA